MTHTKNCMCVLPHTHTLALYVLTVFTYVLTPLTSPGSQMPAFVLLSILPLSLLI